MDYQDENRELAVSFNIVLDEKLKQKLKKVQAIIQKEIPEKRFYENTPHLAVCTKFMPITKVERYKKEIENIFEEYKKFSIIFTTFSPSVTGNYIFLNLDQESKKRIIELNRYIKDNTKDIGFESPKNLPPKYPFDPHISIIKLEEYQIQRALNLINENFNNVSMAVTEFELTVEKRDEKGFAYFPVELIINLK